MKKLILSTVISFISLSLISQSCLPEGITFSTQEQIDNFQTDYSGCTEIEGDVLIEGDDITNLDGINVLTTLGGKLTIDFCINLNSITGLSNVNTIGGRLWFSHNYSLTSLIGLNSLTYIGGDLVIQLNHSLTNLSGLDNLTTIGGSLALVRNDSLIDLTGLGSLTNVGGSINIQLHQSLINLVGLESLTAISSIYIWGNVSLANLNGLDNLTDIGGIYIGFPQMCIGNPVLTSLSGLENIEASTISELIIGYNSSLSTCEIQSICNYLAMPGANIAIGYNAPGCNSQQEVEEACETVSIYEVSLVGEITSSPNPFTNSTTLSYELKQLSTVQLSIYNQLGQLVYHHSAEKQQGEQQLQWDAKDQAEALYFYRLKAGDQVTTGKLVKN